MVTSVPLSLLDEHLARLVERVDVGVVAVAAVGELLQRRVLEVAHAEAEHGQEHARSCALSSISRDQARPGSVDADVEVAVGGEDDAVDAALDEVSAAAMLVGQLDARAAVGRAARLQPVERARGSARSIRPASDGSTSPDAPA